MGWKIRKDGKFDTGRPQKIDEAVMDKLHSAYSLGCSDAEACAYADISQSLLYKYQKAHSDFMEWKEALKQKPILKAKNTIAKNLDDPKIALEYLKAKCKSEFGQRMEITGTDGSPLTQPIINILPITTKETKKNGK